MDYRKRIAEILGSVRGKTGDDAWMQALLDLAQLVDDEAGDAFDDGLVEGREEATEGLESEYQDGYDDGYDEGFEEGCQQNG